MAQYGKASYWDERYTKDPEPFDWYQRYSGVKDIIAQHIKKEDNILMVGAGNSRLSEEMYDDGYRSIENVDISKVVIEQMQEKYKDRAMTWKVMNVTSLNLPDESFDVALDKGTLDSILCGEGSTANVSKMCSEISRVLKPGGVYVVLSYGLPDNRLTYLENAEYGWTVDVQTIPKPTVSTVVMPDAKDATSVHYVYVCRKGAAGAGAGDGAGERD